jgi:hypothetical protein
MDAGLIDRIETNVERVASVLFGGAVGFAVYGWLWGSLPRPELAASTGGAAAIAVLLCRRALNAIGPREPRHSVPMFDVRDIESFGVDELLLTGAARIGSAELVLTDADRLHPGELLLTEADRREPVELLLTEADRLHPGELFLTDRLHPARQEPLVLDDILAELGPDARVVRLFDRKAMPTPGQLKSRIDSHLNQRPAQAEAAKALSDALAELRRSLR